ncbi:MAG: hypothetical protein J0L64_15105 [Acidobacteria bacterium]|nr:hypothetical protein [Acidobacteriota bacterium]
MVVVASELQFARLEATGGFPQREAPGEDAMHAVQIVIGDPGRAREISRYLTAKTQLRVRRSPIMSARSHQVLLVDELAFRGSIHRLVHPERVVLLAPRPGDVWEEAMRAGVVSIVSENDSLETVLMAILCADLRLTRQSACPGFCANIPRSMCPLCARPQGVGGNSGKRLPQRPDMSWPQSCTWKM